MTPIENRNRRSIIFPLWGVLIVPFVVQIALAVGLVGYLSYRNGQAAVNNVAQQLRSEITQRIEEHVQTFLSTPHHINQINANAMRQGWLDTRALQVLERHFWEQVQIFDSVTSIYFGNTEGGLVNAGREGAEGALYVILTDEFASGPFNKYATDAQGEHMELLATVPDFDARTRPWYTAAVQKGTGAWSEMYILFTGQDMAIAASRPVYDDQGRLLGVVSVDIFTSHLGDFLENTRTGQNGQSFIMERSGLLIASSTDEKPFTAPGDGEAPRRLHARESSVPIIRDAADFLTGRFSDYHAITDEQSFEYTTEGERQFLHVLPVQDCYGIDWLVVVVVPEADFMGQITASNRTNITLIVVASILAVSLGLVTTGWVARSMARLNVSTQALARGEWQQIVPLEPILETVELTHSFNTMARQLQQTLQSLTAEITERQRVEEVLRANEQIRESLLAQIQEQSRRTQQIIDTVPEGVIVFDAAGRITLVNPLGEKDLQALAHARVGDVLTHLAGRPLADFLTWPAYQRWHEVTAENRIFQIIARPLVSDPDAQAHVLVIRNMTWQHEIEHRAQQQARLAAVGQLAAGIAHDFNNVMASILLYAQMMPRTEHLSPQGQEHVAIIIQQVQHASRMIQQILDFARQSVLRRHPLDLLEIFKEEIKLLERTLPENIEIALTCSGDLCLANADPTRIQQLVMNLAINARDAMLQGGKLHIALERVELDAEASTPVPDMPPGAWVKITVTDTGTGIPENVLPHIFEPFFTTKAPLGSGLGLAQVHGIVEQHEGRIDVETRVGEGTTITVYLPCLPEIGVISE